MSFAERHGFVESKAIQINSIDSALGNRLHNAIQKYFDASSYTTEELTYVVDKLGYRVGVTKYDNWMKIDSILSKIVPNVPWYMPYEIIECFFEAKITRCGKIKEDESYQAKIWLRDTSKEINSILEEEKSGYRLLQGKFINITNETEIEEISKATTSPYNPVNTHIQKALSLYSDRKQPDYENSIKESISAVEAMCCIITGMTGSSATLGSALRKLEDNGVIIHNALREAFSKMYGYTSDADGIRHGGIDFTNASSEDAKYMLIVCSAFVNYLVEKHSKIVEKN